MIHPFKNTRPRIGQRVFIAPDATIIGDVQIGDDASIWFQCIVRGDIHWIRIGARTNIQDKCCLHVTHERWPLLIEDEVSIAHNVMLHGCTIRRGALVGMSSTVMDGAEIGEGCLVAAGSLVKEGFVAPPHTLIAGWPAVVKGDLKPAHRGMVDGLWGRYVRYKDQYLADGWKAAEGPGHP
jgi:carbonic anhydrase/acetyltransferase-like protein (isoleucine patch superfamily)